MEQYIISGENATILVDLVDSAGNFLVPDNSLYSYKITDNTGKVLQEESDISLEPLPEEPSPEEPSGEQDNSLRTEDTEVLKDQDNSLRTEDTEVLKDQVLIETTDVTNTKEEGNIFSLRYVYVTFKSKGKPYKLRKIYNIIDEFYFTATPNDVRDVFGVSDSELPDDSIDLVKNYIILSTKMGDIFTNAIKAGDLSNIRANRLLVLTTALSLFNSIRLRLVESESSGTNSYLRSLKYANLDELEQAIKDEIADIEEDITGIADISMENYTPYHLGTRSPDAITGEEVS